MAINRAEFIGCLLSIVLILALSGCATTQRDWKDANRLGTIESYEQFLQKHPNSEQADAARRLLPEMRVHRDWNQAEAINTIESYEQFLQKHPNSEKADAVRVFLPELRADRDWNMAKTFNTIRAYEKFLGMHPQSRYERQAKDAQEILRFKQAKESNSIVDYETYLKHHPDASHAKDAHRRLRTLRYADARQKKTVAAFESFLAQYSSGTDVNTIRSELPALKAMEKAWKTARLNNTVNSYKGYLARYPKGCHTDEARARIQIHALNSGFGIAEDFTEEQIETYIQRIRNEHYSTIIQSPTEIEYYKVTGPRHTVPKKEKAVASLPPSTRVCSLNLEAANLSVTALYVDANPPVDRALFQRKWEPTMVHTGFAGPGLEINLPFQRQKEFKRFLKTFSINYRVMYSTSGGILGYVIPDLVVGSDHDSSPYPHQGIIFSFEHNDRPIVFKVDGVEGMPMAAITTYRQALELKTFLAIAGNK